MKRNNHASVVRLTSLAILAALVVVLQTVASGIRIGPVPISLTLVPIVVGAILFGPGAGAGLGFVFGLVCLIAGVTGADQFTYLLWTASPFWLIVVCVGKAVLCGLCAGIAGVVASSRITSADTNNIGLNYELDAILAVALGGNSLAGGRFNLAGSIIGAYTIQAITTTMYNMGVPSAVTPVFKAVVVIVIVAVQAPPVKAWFKKRSAAKALTQKEVASA